MTQPQPFKFQFAAVIVGAATRRPRSEMLRIRIGLRRIRKILPLRAINDRPYGIICNGSINCNLPLGADHNERACHKARPILIIFSSSGSVLLLSGMPECSLL